ncbi:MAG: hypothetical protein WC969_09610 [Elusimicrobiota bacterium]
MTPHRPAYQSLRSLGILLVIVSVLSFSAAFREGAIIGAGLFVGGVSVWLAGFGAKKGWKRCPVLPLFAALAAFLLMFGGCFASLSSHAPLR